MSDLVLLDRPQCDNGPHLSLPHHPPEVPHSAMQGGLCVLHIAIQGGLCVPHIAIQGGLCVPCSTVPYRALQGGLCVPHRALQGGFCVLYVFHIAIQGGLCVSRSTVPHSAMQGGLCGYKLYPVVVASDEAGIDVITIRAGVLKSHSIVVNYTRSRLYKQS